MFPRALFMECKRDLQFCNPSFGYIGLRACTMLFAIYSFIADRASFSLLSIALAICAPRHQFQTLATHTNLYTGLTDSLFVPLSLSLSSSCSFFFLAPPTCAYLHLSIFCCVAAFTAAEVSSTRCNDCKRRMNPQAFAVRPPRIEPGAF